MKELDRIHITPEDYLAQFEDYPDAAFSYVNYYIRPYGPRAYNEMSDTHYQKDDSITYHEHASGYETFLVDKGTVECNIDGKRALAHKGDMVHIVPFTAHGFKYLEQDTVWRELFMDIMMNDGMMDQQRMKAQNRARLDDPVFIEAERKRHDTIWYDYWPAAELSDPSEMPQLRPFDFSFATFSYPGVTLKQKVRRSEYEGVKEIWQVFLQKGSRLFWNEENPYPKLYVVYSGSVHCELNGREPFDAAERDILHIPVFLGGSITAAEDTILLDYNCQGCLFRALTEIEALRASAPSKMTQERAVETLRKYGCYIELEGGMA